MSQGHEKIYLPHFANGGCFPLMDGLPRMPSFLLKIPLPVERTNWLANSITLHPFCLPDLFKSLKEIV